MMNLPSIKTVLVSNAVFSGMGGVALLLAPKYLGSFLGAIPLWLCAAMGVGLVLFSLQVFWVCRDLDKTRRYLSIIFWADCFWVLLTPVALIIFQQRLSFWGSMMLIDIALIVAIFSFLERQHLKIFEEQKSLLG